METVFLALFGFIILLVGGFLGYVAFRRGVRIELGILSQELERKAHRITELEVSLTVLSSSLEEAKTQIKEERNASFALREQGTILETANRHLSQSKADLMAETSRKIHEAEHHIDNLRQQKEQSDRQIIELRGQEPMRIEEYRKNIDRLTEAHRQLDRERERDSTQKAELEARRLEELRATWARFEADVEQRMRLICQELAIPYVDKEKFPFGGKPDNAVHICDEYIIFDSKSPQGEDLANFPTHIRREADAVKKYTKTESVKKDIFFVVPTNAVGAIENTFMPLGPVRVHVITVEALRPILMQLKKIEDYEFAEQLSPEDREKIGSVIGRMAHGMKRRIQVDYYFANEYLSVLTDAENLPEDILREAQGVERSSKLNPPLQKRAKTIETDSLVKDREKLVGKVEAQDIHLGPELDALNSIPLHRSPE